MLASLPTLRIRWSDPRLRWAWAVLGAAAVIALVFLPKVMINGDETLYAGEARLLLRGRLVPIYGDPLPAPYDPPNLVIRYPYGWPAVLALGALVGFRAMFLAPLLFHLLGGAAAARMFVRRGLPSWLVAVYLFHPVFWNLSRTLMSDVPTAAMLLVAMDLWENRQPLGAAPFFGFPLFVRIASAIPLFGFGLAILPELRARWRDALWLIGGAAVGGALLVTFNVLTHGHPYKIPQAVAVSIIDFAPRSMARNVALYAGGLLLIPPFPLLCLTLRPRSVDRWALAGIPSLIFFAVYGYHDESPRLLETFLGGQRLVVPLHVFATMATAPVWGRVVLLRRAPVVLAAGAIAAAVQCLATRHLYRRYEVAVDAIAQCHPRSLAYNESASRIAYSNDVGTWRMIDRRDPVGEADLVLVSERILSNRPDAGGGVAYQPPPSLVARAAACRRVGDYMLWDLAGTCPALGKQCELPSVR